MVRGWLVVLVVGGLLVACGGATDGDGGAADNGGAVDDGGAASVSFVTLEDGATVERPLEVCLVTENVEIEPAGEVREGAGHHHIIVDPTEQERQSYTSGAAEAIPNDATHIHMGDGADCTTLELEPGQHELMAVVADGAHVPLDPPVVTSVTVTVE